MMDSRTKEIIQMFIELGRPEQKDGMARYGINVQHAFGVSVAQIRKIARYIGKDHDLALALWDTAFHEARLLASFIDDPNKVDELQLESWVKDINSWDICDLCCNNLFRKTSYAYQKILEWINREEEFVKRAGFVMIATLAVHDKKTEDQVFIDFLPLIVDKAADDRNFVRKAVNWALRQIGKRNLALNKKAVETAEKLLKLKDRSAGWIANNALKELKDEKTIERLKKRKS